MAEYQRTRRPIPPLRALRHAKGLTQMQLAAKAGISQKAVSALETGERGPGLDFARHLADALEEHLDVVFPYASRRGTVE